MGFKSEFVRLLLFSALELDMNEVIIFNHTTCLALIDDKPLNHLIGPN